MDAGIASVVAVQADETQVEVGLVGPEGMTGTAVVLGGDQSPHSTYIQVAGEAQWIKADQLRKAMRASDSLRALLLKYVQTFMVQTTPHGHRQRARPYRPAPGAVDFDGSRPHRQRDIAAHPRILCR